MKAALSILHLATFLEENNKKVPLNNEICITVLFPWGNMGKSAFHWASVLSVDNTYKSVCEAAHQDLGLDTF